MNQRWVIGLASGSSADGIDATLLDLEGVGLELRIRQLHALQQPYTPELRESIRRLAGAEPAETRQVARLHRLLGETFAGAARAVADRASLSLQKVQCIGCPGHLVCHDVEGRFPTTLALGMPAVVAERCGVTTISDFRARDLAAGGVGSPLAALPEHILFRHPREARLLLHLGGTARVVLLPANGKVSEVIGFEAGPCNHLLDTLMRQLTGGREPWDPGGKHAVQGRCLEPLLRTWLAHPWLHRRPPRCLPRNLFGEEFAAQAIVQTRQLGGSLHDLLCTATWFVAQAVVLSVRRFLAPRPIDRVLLSGGGTRNGLLWHLLEQQLPLGRSLPLARTDEVGVPGDARKAIIFALLAALTLDGVAGNAPSATGAAGSRLLGSITPGSAANWTRCLAWMAAQTAPTLPLLPDY
jgi:anhydro-N-acetylmuramic acid kinase